MFVPKGILYKSLQLDEKRSYVHTEDKRIKEISPKMKASPAKAHSEKLGKIEILHQPDTLFTCLSNTTKSDNICVYI